ncbi:uncharacterized protein LOC131148823 isoform X2 [Malania oleifera]|uniref:uncharacterized protein LOC131148823 isoform X2 n=1 Tax=Malania oleifera TaxID=397392 RepID=UPI0025ADE20D|nr:uncharacterized protein LOC131148823 isoform X2 [Malania oleifera]
MFTEGLDESAINWIKQGSNAEQVKSPLAEKFGSNSFPKSPLVCNSPSCVSSPVLPPLKFHSGLLGSHSIVAPILDADDDDGTDDNDESVASAPDALDGNCSDLLEDESSEHNYTDFSGKPSVWCCNEEILDLKTSPKLNQNTITRSNGCRGSSIIRGLSKENISIDIPVKFERRNDGELRSMGCAQRNLTPGGSCQPHRQVLECNESGIPNHERSLKDVADLGTPSAPPIIDSEREGYRLEVDGRQTRPSEVLPETETGKASCASGQLEGFSNSKESSSDWRTQSCKSSELGESQRKTLLGESDAQIPFRQANTMDNSPYYDASDQFAWQTLIAYDACIRLCLHAWATGCTEAPEFLHDECFVLRNAFGLHKFLLQPRGVQPMEGRTAKCMEQIRSSKGKNIVGNIRVEVKKLRMIPRQKLKSTYSRGSIYMQAGADYVRHLSSFLKASISSFGLPSLSVMSEEPLSCLLHLKSCREDTMDEPGSAVCLLPGTGDYHVFFPESQGDALSVEIQDTKKCVQGRATIAISSLTDNPSDRIRWWPIFHDDHECVGKIQLSIGSTITFDETSHVKSGPVVETLAYDLLLEAAMRAQNFHSRNLRLHGPWKWLLTEFSDYYGVSDSYTKLRHLSHVMNVATPTKHCLELVHELLDSIIKARSEKSLSRQEKSILLNCETQIESLLAIVFQNYKSLDEASPTGLADLFVTTSEIAAPALAPAVQIYTLLHDILAQDAQTMLRNYLQAAAAKRCRKHMMETDELVASNTEGSLMDLMTISTAYLKMKNLCINMSNEIQADIKIHNQHVFPRLRCFLAAWPPSSPLPHVNELLVAAAEFERNLELWNMSPAQGGVDSRTLFHNYIMVWVEDMQLNLLELCKAEKVPWSGVTTNHSTTPFAEEIYGKIKGNLIEYEVLINRWPQYSLILENAVANVERAIIKALERQYSDNLTPLKDSIPKRLNMHVQKLARRQSATLYYAPAQLGTFLNTIKRILDVLHCRVEEILKSWASYMPATGDRKSLFGEQMNGVTVLLRTKYKNYAQATVGKLISNMQVNRSTRLKRVLEEIKEADGEAEIREKMQMLSSQLIESISNLHEVFASRIFVQICRGLWDAMGQTVLSFLEGRKENRVWYNGSYYALGILDDTFASQMQRLQGNSLQEKDLDPPRAVIEARSILCRDTTNAIDPTTYFYI